MKEKQSLEEKREWRIGGGDPAGLGELCQNENEVVVSTRDDRITSDWRRKRLGPIDYNLRPWDRDWKRQSIGEWLKTNTSQTWEKESCYWNVRYVDCCGLWPRENDGWPTAHTMLTFCHGRFVGLIRLASLLIYLRVHQRSAQRVVFFELIHALWRRRTRRPLNVTHDSINCLFSDVSTRVLWNSFAGCPSFCHLCRFCIWMIVDLYEKSTASLQPIGLLTAYRKSYIWEINMTIGTTMNVSCHVDHCVTFAVEYLGNR